MKSIHIIVPLDKENLLLTVLQSLQLIYEKIEGHNNAMVILTVTDEHVEAVIDAIKKIGVGTIFGTYQVYDLEFAARAAELPIKMKTRRASREEILSNIRTQAEFNRNYVLASILAAMLAALGLLTDNVIITIASMIIAPFFGPILGTSLGIVLNINDLRKESLKSEIVGLLLSILTGFVFSMLLPYTTPTTRILAISNPTYIDILFAVIAGVAAAISVVSVAPLALVGVAIAASLVPPATNIGIGLSFMLKGVENAEAIIYGSSLLLSINVLAINSMSILFFWLVGIKPGESIRKELMAKRIARRRLIAIIFMFLVVSAPIILMTVDHYEEKRIENEIKNDIIYYLKTFHPDIEIVKLDVIYSKRTNITYVYLTIGTKTVNSSIYNVAPLIKSFISQNYHVNTKVYLSIQIIA